MHSFNSDHVSDCYELTENEIFGFIVNFQSKIESLLGNWEQSTDQYQKLQISNEIASLCYYQKEIKKWLANERFKIRQELREPEEIYLNYC